MDLYNNILIQHNWMDHIKLRELVSPHIHSTAAGTHLSATLSWKMNSYLRHVFGRCKL